MKVIFTDADHCAFAIAAGEAVFTKRMPSLGGPLERRPVPDFSSMTRQRRRAEERKARKKAARV